MAIFITGATGFVGSRLALRLAEAGHTVHALVRSREKAAVLRHPGIQLVHGDLSDRDALCEGMAGCDRVYHVAALARVWSRDPGLFHATNVAGTVNVLEAAADARVERTVVTSTAGTLGPSRPEKPLVTEENTHTDFFNEYERTKAEAEDRVRERTAGGQQVVIVNPTRVYGPGPLVESNAATLMMQRFVEGNWRFLPGDGAMTGNYVFLDDVVQGHLLAMEKGRSGERYILGGTNASFRELFDALRRVSGKDPRLFRVPVPVVMALAHVQAIGSRFGRPPRITPGWARRFVHDWNVSTKKAERELGYRPTPLEEGIRETLRALGMPTAVTR